MPPVSMGSTIKLFKQLPNPSLSILLNGIYTFNAQNPTITLTNNNCSYYIRDFLVVIWIWWISFLSRIHFSVNPKVTRLNFLHIQLFTKYTMCITAKVTQLLTFFRLRHHDCLNLKGKKQRHRNVMVKEAWKCEVIRRKTNSHNYTFHDYTKNSKWICGKCTDWLKKLFSQTENSHMGLPSTLSVLWRIKSLCSTARIVCKGSTLHTILRE